MTAPGWDYLIVTAAHEAQAAAYREQLSWRRDLGFIPHVRHVLTIADPHGRRVGSGGSTIHCLLTILGRELRDRPERLRALGAWGEALRSLRVLIIHAGGDSRRLPAYSPCGKIFVPVPGDSDRVLGLTLFDRQLPTYLRLPPGAEGQGQVVIATGPGSRAWAVSPAPTSPRTTASSARARPDACGGSSRSRRRPSRASRGPSIVTARRSSTSA
jgi:hypothetical protein